MRLPVSGLAARTAQLPVLFQTRMSSGVIRFGDVTVTVRPSEGKDRIPRGYAKKPEEYTQNELRALRWIAQKDLLEQDMILIGEPGAARRNLIQQYCELTNREMEYVALSRDTTESELKQRRELRSSSAIYQDQAAVRAALHGRVLVLDGIEKAERNLLPLLNNLLENREMNLEDGRFLMASNRFNSLSQSISQDELTEARVAPVHPDFRVVALGLPVPRYPGNPLDPPLRSRLQSRWFSPSSADIHQRLQLGKIEEQSLCSQLANVSALAASLPLVNQEFRAQRLFEGTATQLPSVSDVALSFIGRTAVATAGVSIPHLVASVLPYQHMLPLTKQALLKKAFERFDLSTVGIASLPLNTHSASDAYVPCEVHEAIVAQMEVANTLQHFCLLGAQGVGKTAIAREFARRQNIQVQEFVLHKDLSARDLLQSRVTLPNGDTGWKDSPLVTAAIAGEILLLDGVHRIHPTALTALQQLMHDRELQLPDGSRLLGEAQVDHVVAEANMTTEALSARGVRKIGSGFRVVAMGEPLSAEGKPWVSEEIASLFAWYDVNPLSVEAERHLLANQANLPQDRIDKLHGIALQLRDASDGVLGNVVQLSTRQLLRIARRLATFPGTSVATEIHRATLAPFMPPLLQSELTSLTGPASFIPESDASLKVDIANGYLSLGDVRTRIRDVKDQTKVPKVSFVDNQEHLAVMSELLKDQVLGESVLLIGNQGVGKNKVVDRLLELLNIPREYVQLHRDTTVQSLCQLPSIQSGRLVYEDSPLIRAVKTGATLVIDEADKAPTEVLASLRGFVEHGRLQLPDGRWIVPGSTASDSGGDIVIHPDFHLIVLANRPGYPFLGNDFFATMGDLFSCHIVGNPSHTSEVSILQEHINDRDVINKISSVLQDLRDLAKDGRIDHPFSTREMVSIARHFGSYERDGLLEAMKNVLDYDIGSSKASSAILPVLQKHGIPLHRNGSSSPPVSKDLLGGTPAPDLSMVSEPDRNGWSPSGRHGPARTLPGRWEPIQFSDPRWQCFTMNYLSFKIPLLRGQSCKSVTSDTADSLLFLLNNPNQLLRLSTVERSRAYLVDLPLQYKSPVDVCIIGNSSDSCKTALLMSNGNVLLSSSDLTNISELDPPLFSSMGQMFNQPSMRGTKFAKPAGPFLPKKAITYRSGCNTLQATDAHGSVETLRLSEEVVAATFTSSSTLSVCTHSGTTLVNLDGSMQRIHDSCGKGCWTLWPSESSVPVIASNSFWGLQKEHIFPYPPHGTIYVDDARRKVLVHSDDAVQVVDLTNQKVMTIPIEERKSSALLTTTFNDTFATMTLTGQVDLFALTFAPSFQKWKQMAGSSTDLRLEVDRHSGLATDTPKHGKVDPDNNPHVGGNTWAGGTGGRDTAGLGGKGGPYRIDAGHDVHQLSELEKADVPDEIKEAARSMGEQAFQERLNEIQMTPHESSVYERFFRAVEDEIQQLRQCINSLNSQGSERTWLRHQSAGELDDLKLVDGLSGDSAVFRKRADVPSMWGDTEPSLHLTVLLDVSASMFRFDGIDSRLQRVLECACLVMEGLSGNEAENKIVWNIVGHSGEDDWIPFCTSKEDLNEASRLKVLHRMFAHAQFCHAGDTTFQAAQTAIDELAETPDANERVVVLFTDANFARYGISTSQICRVLARQASVRVYLIVLGNDLSGFDSAILNSLPAGKCFSCQDLKTLPRVLTQILQANVL
eukprot:m.131630 g.131630  ORF g.131630 m.131630 type:complete len:1706 (-) comp15913_c0_seq3:46-5163(-)